MDRKSFIQNLSLLSSGLIAYPGPLLSSRMPVSGFAKRLRPVGRMLELEGYYVWCNSPIFDAAGKVHVFFSRWKAEKKMSGWIKGSEIAHAVADVPEGPYTVTGTILAPRGPGFWDATTCHNPSITTFDNKYYLYYMGNSNGKTNTKRIGVAVAGSLNGPWQRFDHPILEPGSEGAWDDHCTTNPSVLRHADGRYWLYYKSWNTKDYQTQTGPVRGNRKYGLAFGDRPEGPFKKYKGNPVIDFSKKGNNAQLEDAFIWEEQGMYHIIARDMGYYNHTDGIIMRSENGISWSDPKTAYYPASHYIRQPPPPSYLTKYGRFERPQLLLKKGKPVYLFTTTQGGKYMTSSPFIFKIEPE
ncbi:glycoside hydrolase family protein [Niabella aurantiaca]|uniref:glycoside hydrolase family protein n=1 Tax=Niabella aurantiaca TaxID=379900 RepID=UPI0003643A40|nr:glycoside hydrolase family protein [Niabella aurantiaca]